MQIVMLLRIGLEPHVDHSDLDTDHVDHDHVDHSDLDAEHLWVSSRYGASNATLPARYIASSRQLVYHCSCILNV